MKKHLLIALMALLPGVVLAQSIPASFQFSTSQRGPVIGPLHYGIFYEEINHAGDGGLYGELIRNGSMEESSSKLPYWETLGAATYSVSSQNLLNGAQRHSMHLNLSKAGDGVRNNGFWGINVVAGQTYRASFWVRTVNDWSGSLTLTLENADGKDLGHTIVRVADAAQWRKYSVEIMATESDHQGWFSLRGSKSGTIYLDCVSLFPPTYKNRENGMRRDLAEKLEALHPRFMRFPGGCYIEGGKRYQWKHTVGPVEERLGIYNSHWGYPVSNGMGFHEFLQLAEDLGAEPLFVVNVGLGHGWLQDYQHIEGYIQEALDALEYCNGDITTFWGAKRAAAGHPESFNLRLLEIGNENYNFHADTNEDQSEHYAERFHQFYQAIKARYPDVICIGNVESWGTDHPTWRNQYAVDMVDEHYYRSPDWFASNYHKYDNASRSSHKIYNGEYAVTQDFGVNGTLKAALGEAIYMAGMERNSDVCVMASYAPIFMNENEAQWRPDMIHYNSSSSFGTPSYWAQQMMASTVGHQNITWTETGNSIGLTGSRLGLGSWGTDVTYSNIRVTNAQGNVVYKHNDALSSPATTMGTAHALDVVTDDCTIELDAVKNSGNEGFLITFAYADANNYAWWNLGGWNNASHGVEQAVNGSKQTLATAEGSIETGITYHIKIVRSGFEAKLYLDNVLVHTVTLSSVEGQRLFICASLNEAEDMAILKVINYNATPVPSTFSFADATMTGTAEVRVMANADNYAENSMQNPLNVCPQTLSLPVEHNQLVYEVPANSLNVIQIPLTAVSEESKLLPATTLPSPAVSYSFESGAVVSDNMQLQGSCEGGASVIQLDDGNYAAYTGADDANGYLNLGQEAAQAIGAVLNGHTYSVSMNMLLQEGGHFNHYCWAWNVNNGTSSYIALINRANNQDWYFECVGSSVNTRVSSGSGLSQREWHNITVTVDANVTNIYVDGELRNSQPTNANVLTLNASTNAWIGRSPFTADSIMSNTFFDDFAVYDCVLTPAQVLALYQTATSKSPECPSLHPEPDTTPNADALELIGDKDVVDITSLLVNPDFADGNHGWEGTPFSAAPGTVVEHFSQLFDTYQVLRNMPAGHYRLEWQGFYRNGNIANAYIRHSNGSETMAEVYAAIVTPAKVADIASIPMHSLFTSQAPYTYEPYTFPDNVATAHDAFQDGYYGQQLEFSLKDISSLRIGLRNFVPTVYDWACVDNFRLIYIGSYETGISQIVNNQTTNSFCYDLCGRKFNRPSKGIYIYQGKKILINKKYFTL